MAEKGHKKISSGSDSSSDSSDNSHKGEGSPERSKRWKEKMDKEKRCVCKNCPPGTLACDKNFKLKKTKKSKKTDEKSKSKH